MLRDKIAYEIYIKDRAANARMPFKIFSKDKTSFVADFKELADAILALPELKEMRGKAEKADFYDALPSMRVLREWKEKSEALDILEYGYPQEVQNALEKVRGRNAER